MDNNINLPAERLSQFISYLQMNGLVGSKTDFANKCGLSRSYLSQLMMTDAKSAKSITPNVVSIIASKFPMLNPCWLVTGESDMLRSDLQSEGPNQSSTVGVLIDMLREKDEIIREKDKLIGELIRKYQL